MKPSLEELLDLHGGDLDAWPDAAAAREARVAAMRDPGFRRALDATRAADRSLAALAQQMETSPALNTRFAALRSSLSAKVAAQAERRRAFSATMLTRLAASVVIACGLGVGAGQVIPDQTGAQADAYHELLLGADSGPFNDERDSG